MRIDRRQALTVIGGGLLAPFVTSCSPVSRRFGAGGTEPLVYQGLLEVARLIESREITSSALTHAVLDRILAIDGRLKSYVTLTDADAMRAAQVADEEIAAGRYRGPLHGIPFAVKDLFYTGGVPTMGGMKAMADFVPEHDATVVSRLRDAGAILLGKLNMTEAALGAYHPDVAIPRNPWNPAYWAGASSSGSGVATAAGLCFAALSTDTGGSIRLPSMANGVVGLKPTYGRVSRYGVIPLAPSLDHVGPMARRVADVALVLQAIAGHDPNDPTSLPDPVPDLMGPLDLGVEGMRVGIDRRYAGDGVNPSIVTAIDAALGVLTSLGAQIVEIEMPSSPQPLLDLWFPIAAREALESHAATFPSRADEHGLYMREFLGLGAQVTDEQYQALGAIRADYVERLRAVLGSVDAVACPAGGAPFEVSDEIQYGSMSAVQPMMANVHMEFTIPADLAGTPAIVVPCGFSEAGLPYSIQLMGDRMGEPTLCRIAQAYEQATEWHRRHPEV